MSQIINTHFLDNSTFQFKLIHKNNFFQNLVDILSFLILKFFIDNIISIVVLFNKMIRKIFNRKMIIVFLGKSHKHFLTNIFNKLPIKNKKFNILFRTFLHHHPLSQQMQMHCHEISTDFGISLQ